MTRAVVIFALALSGANWLLFLAVTAANRLAVLRLTLGRGATARSASRDEPVATARAQPDRLVEATGTLAAAFRTAGPEATAAAMSLACLLIAAVAAGVADLR